MKVFSVDKNGICKILRKPINPREWQKKYNIIDLKEIHKLTRLSEIGYI